MKKLFSNIKGDAFGGITAGIIALPLALAFGVSSGLGPAAGLYGAIFISFFAALFGGTNTQISGPTAPMTAVSMVVIATIISVNDGDIDKALPIILTVFLLAGLLQIGLGAMGLGKYIKYIPYPVVSGFMTAIGIIILITQILPSIGYYVKNDKEFVEKFKPRVEQVIFDRNINELKNNNTNNILELKDFKSALVSIEDVPIDEINAESKNLAASEASGVWGTIKILPRAIQQINWLEFMLALGTIFIIYGFKKLTKAVPSTLVALLVMTCIAIGFKLNYKPIEEIPSGLPIPNLEIFTGFSLAHITPYIFTALTLALLGAIDSLLTSVVADNMTKTRHKPNKELIGQGIGNGIASIFGGIPGAGATIRTVINISSGGKTKLSGMIAGLLLLIILVGLGPVASKIPAAVLSGILITVGVGVMDYKGLKAIPTLPKDLSLGSINFSSEVLIMIIVLLLSTFWNLVYAVGIGLVLASLIFMKKAGGMLGERSLVTGLTEEPWTDETAFPDSLKHNIFIKHINGPLFFGSTSDFLLLKSQLPETAETVIIRLDKMEYMDQSGLYAMEDMLYDLTKKKTHILFIGLHEQPRYMMERIDIIPDLVPNKQIFDNFDDCIKWIKINIKDKH
jgi:SulP family sulfate permease